MEGDAHAVGRRRRQLAEQRGQLVECRVRPARRAVVDASAPRVSLAADRRAAPPAPRRRPRPAAPRSRCAMLGGVRREAVRTGRQRGVAARRSAGRAARASRAARRPRGSRARTGCPRTRAARSRRAPCRPPSPARGRGGRRCSTRSARSRSAPRRRLIGAAPPRARPAGRRTPGGPRAPARPTSRSCRVPPRPGRGRRVTWTSDGPPEASARSTAGAPRRGASAHSAWMPNARPMAAKSGEYGSPSRRKSVTAVRPKCACCPPLMLIQPELSRTTVQTGVPSMAAAASSCIVCRKSPSPQIASTWASGRASCAPMAAGSVKPMVEKPPEVMCVRGSRVTQRCLTMPCGRPAPVTTIASARVAAWTSRTARAIVIGVASEPDLTSTCSSQASRSARDLVAVGRRRLAGARARRAGRAGRRGRRRRSGTATG